MPANKVILGSEILVDLTGDTATAADTIEGKTLHLASGAKVVGTLGAATQSSNGLMSAADKKKLDGIAAGATANTGTVTKISTGAGLTGGDITGTGTVKAKLKSETASTLDSAAMGTTANKQYAVGVDKSGYLSVNIPWTDNNTKNTAGSTDSSSKLFLIGATSQAANPQTYSHDTAYVGTDGCLYSGGSKVLTSHQDISGKKNTQSAVSDPTASGTSLTFIATISQNAQGVITPTKKTVASASQSAAGLMSAADKKKLDGITGNIGTLSYTVIKTY